MDRLAELLRRSNTHIISQRQLVEKVSVAGEDEYYDVTEYIFQWGHPLLRKLAWVRTPVDEMVIDGRPNAFTHVNYCATGAKDFEEHPYMEEAARERVRIEFRRVVSGRKVVT